MRTKQQLFIDQYLVRPVAYAMNFLVRIAGKILSIDHSLDHEFKRIVICKFKGLGSIIQSTPMLAAIRERFPNAEIIFVSTRANVQLLQKIDLIDTVIAIEDKSMFRLVSSLFRSLWQLIRMRPDVYIDLEIYSNFSTLVALFSFSKNRIGFYLRSSSFKMGIYTHMMFFNSQVLISEVYLQIARLFGEIKEVPGLYPLYKDLKVDATFLPDKNYILVNPNASDLRIERRWPAANFTLLIEQCRKLYPEKQIILIGGPSERIYAQTVIADITSENVMNWAGKTSIDELIILIKNADLVITNDTGPMHIAFACKAPTICLFGPCSPDQYGSENAVILYRKVYCSPCVHDFSTPPCNGNNACMQLIGVTAVMDAVTNYFNAYMQPAVVYERQYPVYFEADNVILGLVNRADLE